MLNSSRRVLIIEPSGNLWGSERAMLDLCDGLRSTNWDVGICCPPNTPIVPLVTPDIGELYPTFVANLHRKTKLARAKAAYKTRRAIKDFQPDLIYVNQAGATKVTLLAAVATKLPVVSHIRLLEDAKYISQIVRNQKLNHLICISKFVEQAFHKRTRHDATLHTIFDGYRPVRSRANDIDHRNVVVCPGRFAHVKGQDILIKAAQKTRLVRQDLKYRVVGRTDERDPFNVSLQQLCCDLDLEDVVSLESFNEDIWPLLESADFMVCPSRIEPLGRVIFEAWDAGILPIAHRGSGGPAETIAAADAGILYETQTPACLANAILNAYDLSPDSRRQMVERGQAWMIDNIDPKVYARKITDVFDAAIDQTK